MKIKNSFFIKPPYKAKLLSVVPSN